MRNKPDTLSSLGRAPARTTLPQPPPPPIPPDRGAVRRWVHAALFDNVALKLLSMVLAVTVFLLVSTDKDREIVARIGVSYTLPDDKVLVSDQIEDVRVTVKGPWQRLRRFDQREVDRINLDLRHVASGEIALTPDMIHLPSGLTISQIEPRTIPVAFDRRIEKVLEVRGQVFGRPQHGYVVAEVKATPATIQVRGPETALAALSAINTRDVTVTGQKESFVAETEVSLPHGIDAPGGDTIVLRITIDEELVTQKLRGLAVNISGDGIDPARWSASPAQVEITLTGALLAVEKAKSTVVALAKLPVNDGKSHDVAVAIGGLSPEIGVKISPPRVKISPAKPTPSALP